MEKSYTLTKLDSRAIFLMVTIISKVGIKQFAESFRKDNLQKLVTQNLEQMATAPTLSVVENAADLDEDGIEDLEDLDLDEAEKSENLEEAVGFDFIIELIGIVLENIPKCEKDVYKLLAHCSDLTAKQISALPADEFVTMIGDFIRMPGFESFIKAALKLLSNPMKG